MEKAKVYFIKDITPENIVKIYDVLGKKLEGKVAVKLHSGEKGNQNYMKPEMVKNIVEHVNGTVVECNTAYEGARDTTEKHQKLMEEHGWTKYFKVDIMDSEGEDKVLLRLQVIDMARSILNSIAIDNEGEEYTFESIPMAGVKDVIDSTCNMLSAVTNIPQTILFGRSPAGMNSTGESDMENFYNMVENIQKQNMKANSRTLIRLILIQGMYEGKISDIPKYKVKFAPLWSLSETEQANVDQTKAQTAYTKAQTAQVYMDSSVLDPAEVRASLAKESEFDIL